MKLKPTEELIYEQVERAKRTLKVAKFEKALDINGIDQLLNDPEPEESDTSLEIGELKSDFNGDQSSSGGEVIAEAEDEGESYYDEEEDRPESKEYVPHSTRTSLIKELDPLSQCAADPVAVEKYHRLRIDPTTLIMKYKTSKVFGNG